MSRDFAPAATMKRLGGGLLALLVMASITLALAPAAAQAESYLAEGDLDNENGGSAIHWSIDQDGKLVIKTLDSEWVGSPDKTSVGRPLPLAKLTFPYYPWQKYADSITSAEIAVGKAYVYYDSDLFGQPDAPGAWVDSYVMPSWLGYNRLEYLFYGLENMKTVSLAGLDPTGLTSTQGMFEGCSSLKSIDFTGCARPFDTSQVDDMRSMFKGCESLVQIKGLESFDTSNVGQMSSMFEDCASLPSLDIRHFNTSKATDMHRMFAGCESLTSLDVSNLDTSHALSLHGMFEGCKNLATITGVENLDTTGVAANGWGDFYAMFQGCASLKSLDLSRYDFSKAGRLGYLLEGCSALESVKLPAPPQANFTDMDSVFAYCTSLKSVDLSGLDTSHVTNMKDMFYGCKSLTTLDLSTLTTAAGADLTRMMASCTGLKSVKLAGADLSNARQLDYLFASDENLASVDFGAVTATSATSLAYMFRGCTSLEGLDLSGFGTPAATDMREMFKGCISLTRLSVSGLDTTNVGKMDDIFAQCFPVGGECVLTLGQNSAFTSANTGLTGVWANATGQEFDAADITTGFTAAKAGRYTQVDAPTSSDAEELELEALEELAPGLPGTISDDEEAERVKDALSRYDALTDVQRQKLSASAQQQFEAARAGLEAYEAEQRPAEEKRQADLEAADAFAELMADNYLGSIGSDPAYQRAQEVVAAYGELTDDQRELLDRDAQERYEQLLGDVAAWEEYQDYLVKADAIGQILEPWNQGSYTAAELKSYYDRSTAVLDTMSDSQRERFAQTGGWVVSTYRDLCEAMRDYDNLVAREAREAQEAAEQALRDELSSGQQAAVDELTSAMGSLPADVSSDEDAAAVSAACEAYAAMNDTQKALLALKAGKTVEELDAQFAEAKAKVEDYNEQKGDEPDKPGADPEDPDKPGTDPDDPDKPGADPDDPDSPDKPGTDPDDPDKPGTDPDKPDTPDNPPAPGEDPAEPDEPAAPKPVNIAKAKLTGVADAVYTGKAIQPKPAVVLDGVRLKAGIDYKLSYKANKNVGKATVTVTGMGAYTGTASATFTIAPKGTAVKKLAKGKKAFTVTWAKQAAQVDGYQVRYSLKKNMKSAKSKTVKKAKTTKLAVKKLKPKKTYYVQVRTYKKVGGKTYYSAWSKAKQVKTK